jgi:hypothetical protein
MLLMLAGPEGVVATTGTTYQAPHVGEDVGGVLAAACTTLSLILVSQKVSFPLIFD